MNELTYKTETDLQTQRTNLQLPGEKDGGKGQGVWNGHVHTDKFKMDNQRTYCIAQGTLFNIM